jgi:hypothetical protein
VATPPVERRRRIAPLRTVEVKGRRFDTSRRRPGALIV